MEVLCYVLPQAMYSFWLVMVTSTNTQSNAAILAYHYTSYVKGSNLSQTPFLICLKSDLK